MLYQRKRLPGAVQKLTHSQTLHVLENRADVLSRCQLEKN